MVDHFTPNTTVLSSFCWLRYCWYYQSVPTSIEWICGFFSQQRRGGAWEGPGDGGDVHLLPHRAGAGHWGGQRRAARKDAQVNIKFPNICNINLFFKKNNFQVLREENGQAAEGRGGRGGKVRFFLRFTFFFDVTLVACFDHIMSSSTKKIVVETCQWLCLFF